MSLGNKPPAQLALAVKEGIWAAGGMPAEINVSEPCDGMAQGKGMYYVFSRRDAKPLRGAHAPEDLEAARLVEDGDIIEEDFSNLYIFHHNMKN